MKGLKDYLHLYIGCDFILKNDLSGYIAKLLPEHIGSNGFANVVIPILRPLSDMTDVEMDEYRLLVPPVIKTLHKYVIESAFYTHWLLSKQFDLFNLIESGLAIDKTKLNHLPVQVRETTT